MVAVGYLIDKFVGLGNIMGVIGKAWDGITSFFTGDDEAEKVKELAKTARQLKNHNAELGITTHESRTQSNNQTSQQGQRTYQSGGISTPTGNQYRPLTNQTLTSKSEVALTIKSDKPVKVDKAKSEKGTDLNLDVGELGWSY